MPYAGWAAIETERGLSEAQPLEDEDAALLARVARGDTVAYAAFFDRHGAAAYGVALGLMRDQHEAEDLTQEAFLAVWRNAQAFDAAQGSARTWLLTIVRNRALDVLRSSRYRRQVLGGQDLLMYAPDTENVEATVIQRHERAGLLSALAVLPPSQRRVVELAYFGGYHCAEIATSIGVPVGTVKSRLRLAMQRLRGHLQTPRERVV